MIDPRTAPPLLAAAALTVTREELAFVNSLAPLMGDTPRSVKRFVNVYQLVKILRRARAQTASGSLPEDRIAAFLLAVAEGLPELSRHLFDLAAQQPLTTLSAMLDVPLLAQCPSELKRLQDWLGAPGVS